MKLSHRDELELVLRVACLTEDRDPSEQRAMLGLALRLDQDFAAFTTWNTDRRCPRLVDMVEETYHPDEGKRVGLSKAQRGVLDRLTANWVLCEACDQPVGAHFADDRCPSQDKKGTR